MTKQDRNRRYYVRHRIEILENKKEKDKKSLGTTDFGSHPQKNLSKEVTIIQNEYRVLGLKWRGTYDF